MGEAGRGAIVAGGPEDDVEDDVVIQRIAVVAVVKPVVGAEMDFDVAGEFVVVADFDGGVAEVGAGFEVPPAGEDDLDGTGIGGLERLDALVVPDALDEAFADGERVVLAVGVAENGGGVDVGKGLPEQLIAEFAVSSCRHRLTGAIYCAEMRTRYAILFAVAWPAFAQDPAQDLVVRAIQKAMPAVVNVSTEQLVERYTRDPFEDLFRQFFREPREGAQSLGSGVIVDNDGWLVTNYHVIRRASRITVTLADGTQLEAKFVSGDERNDLALLKVDAKKPLECVELASETEPLLGETVITIGNPFGFDHTVTKGIISAKNRKWPPEDPKFDDILQTDAAINPGNSGGPLINTRGELVGINTAILSQAEGIGFAIPAKRVATLLCAWLSPEKRTRVWLGARFVRHAGQTVIGDVQAESPAAKAGLMAGSAVVSVDGQRFASVLQLQRYLLHKKAGDELKFEMPGGRAVGVKLTALPKLSAVELLAKKFGVTARAVENGLLIDEVEKGSPAGQVGLRRGFVITRVAGEDLESLERLGEQLADLKAGELVSLGLVINERRGAFMLHQTVSVTLKAR